MKLTDLRGPAEHTAEDATLGELWRASLRLLLMLAALALLIVPVLRDLPLGQSVLLQLVIFSGAAALLSLKVLLVIVDVHSLSVLRRVARALIIVGATFAGLNLGAMLVALVRRWTRRSRDR